MNEKRNSLAKQKKIPRRKRYLYYVLSISIAISQYYFLVWMEGQLSNEAFETFLTIDVIAVLILFFAALKLGARSKKLRNG